MKRALFIVFALFIYCQLAYSQLSGTYIIDKTGTGDFLSFTAAIDSLISQGVSGPVVFNVNSGNYDEQLVIPSITGASAVNTITFQSTTLDSSSVVLLYGNVTSSTLNYVVKLDGADYFIFNKITMTATTTSSYGRVLMLANNADYNTIQNCRLIGVTTTTTTGSAYALISSSGTLSINNKALDNLFVDGNCGIYGNFNAGNVGFEVRGNQFLGQYYYGVYFKNIEAPIINNNQFNITSASCTGIYLEACNKSTEIQNNTIYCGNGGYGLYFVNCVGNTIQKGNIINNFISVKGTSTGYGIYFTGVGFYNLFNNSIYVSSQGTSAAFYNITGSNLDIKNNIFANFGGGYAYWIATTSAIATSDYNNFYTDGNYIAYWSVNKENLSDLTAASSKDANSLSVNPIYFSSTNLHTTTSWLDGKGDSSVGVLTDIDGETRQSPPDIGADEFFGIGTPMAGIYTIGGTSPDFSTISSAIDSLNKLGMSAAVTFNIRSGVYTEQLEMLNIAGCSQTNNITIQSETNNSNDVEIKYAGNLSKNYVFRLRSTDNLSIKDITFSATDNTYSKVLLFTGNTRNDSIINCVFNGLGTSTTSHVIYASGAFINNIIFDSNLISGGYIGIYLNRDDANAYSTGIKLNNNILTNQYYYGIYLERVDAPVITHNNIDGTSSSSYYGIKLYYCSNDFKIMYNKINSGGSNGGLILSYTNGVTTKKGLIANNYIETSGATAYGIYLSLSNYHEIYYNTVKVTSTSLTAGRAFFTSGGNNITAKNNIFANLGGGYSVYNADNPSTAVVSSDFNDLYTTGNYLAFWNGADRTNLQTYQTTSGFDNNSVTVDPVFITSNDLHVNSYFIDNKGTPVVDVIDDFDGEVRDLSTPDIGADEFTSSLTPLAGVYSIGGASPDYATFSDAASDLNSRGISATVIFNVRPGAYSEHISIHEISGASLNDSIVFQSESGDSSDVVISYNATTAGSNYVIKLLGTDYITFKNLSIVATGSSYSTAILFSGNITNVNILNNNIVSSNSSTSSIIYSYQNILKNILISNNNFSEGGNAVDITNEATVYGTGIIVKNNEISSCSISGISLKYLDAPLVYANKITNTGDSFTGVLISYCKNNCAVLKNKITNTGNGTGIKIDYTNGTVVMPVLVANNFVSVGTSSTAYGIYHSSSNYCNYYYNSVRINSTDVSAGRAFYLNNGTYAYIKNNIFANLKNGYTYYINTPSAVTESNYNDFYSLGTNIARWGTTNITSLAGLQTISSMDANSLFVDPMFYSISDLHILQPLLNEKGTPLTTVTTDIDGIARDASTPDIGAMEFYCETPTFSVLADTVCLGDETIIYDLTSNVALGSTYSWDFDNDWNYDYVGSSAYDTIIQNYSAAGFHTINFVVNQIAGCQDVHTFDVVVTSIPSITATTIPAYCDSANGSAALVVTGGTTPYTYSWSNGESTSSISSLTQGTYTVAVMDKLHCTSTSEVLIENELKVAINQIQGSSCGNADGIAQAIVSGGYTPYSYNWSNGITLSVDSSLTPGMHYVNIIDSIGCAVTQTINIGNNGTGPAITLNSITNNLCAGQTNGSINISISGGVSPYQISWSNGATTEDLTGIKAGTYQVIAMDADSCLSMNDFTVTAPSAISSSIVTTNASCAMSDGKAVIVVSGGVEPYQYQWESGNIQQIEEGLSAGIYSVTVTDNNNCTTVKPVMIANVGGPVISINGVTGVNCNYPNSGAIDIGIAGGSPPYSYLWDNNVTTQDLSNIPEGEYHVSVTDNAGCMGMAMETVSQVMPTAPEICIVTVDTTNGKNLIVWDNSSAVNIASYNIYKESNQSGVYYQIGNVLSTSTSIFTDNTANPLIRSWRYKLTAVDSCGNESELSQMHKTIHLTTSKGIGDDINLVWDHYQGFNFSSYIIYRYSLSAGMEIIDTIPNNLFTYVDQNPPASVKHYNVAALKPTICNVNSRTQTGPYSQSISNIDDYGIDQTVVCMADAGNNSSICGTLYPLQGTQMTVGSTISWSAISGGTFTNPTNTSTDVTVSSAGTYNFVITETLPECSASDTVSITFNSLPANIDSISGNKNVLQTATECYTVVGASGSTFQWTVTGGNILNGQSSNTICIKWINAGQGSISVTETNQNGCVGNAVSTNVSVVSGIDEIASNYNIEIYPNPNKGIFNLTGNFELGETVNINIYDVRGRIIRTSEIKNTQNKLNLSFDLSELSDGIYNLQITTSKAVINQKLIKN